MALKQTMKNNLEQTMTFGKISPQAIEFEQAILGALMIDIKAVERVLPILTIDDFYDDKNKQIYNAIIELFNEAKPIDFIIVCEQLRKNEQLEFVGGSYFITSLTRDVVSSANVEEHARVVKEKSILRSMINMAGNLINEAYEYSADCFDLLSNAELEMAKINNNLAVEKINDFDKSIQDITNGIIVRSEDKEANKIFGLETGFKPIDDKGGACNSDLILIAGGPAEGKSTLGLQIASFISSNVPVAYFSYEMSNEQLVLRIISAVTNIEVVRLKQGNITEIEKKKVIEVGLNIKKNLYIFDKGSMTLNDIKNISRTLFAKKGIKSIFVDSVPLVKTTGLKFGSRAEAIDYISYGLKGIAMELNLPVFAMAQVNREAQKNIVRPYVLSDLRESGGLEQSANLVFFVWRPSYHKFKGVLELPNNESIDYNNPENKEVCFLINAKDRDGETSMTKIISNLKYNKFEVFNEYKEPEHIEKTSFNNGLQNETPF